MLKIEIQASESPGKQSHQIFQFQEPKHPIVRGWEAEITKVD